MVPGRVEGREDEVIDSRRVPSPRDEDDDRFRDSHFLELDWIKRTALKVRVRSKE